MTNDKEKERLLEEFKEKYCFSEMAEDSVIGSANEVFNFFYQEIEAREKKFDDLKKEDNYKAEMINYYIDGLENSANKISHLESIIQAAKGIVKFYEAGDDSELELCIRDFKALQNSLSGTIKINDSNRDTYKVGHSATPLLDKEEPQQ